MSSQVEGIFTLSNWNHNEFVSLQINIGQLWMKLNLHKRPDEVITHENCLCICLNFINPNKVFEVFCTCTVFNGTYGIIAQTENLLGKIRMGNDMQSGNALVVNVVRETLLWTQLTYSMPLIVRCKITLLDSVNINTGPGRFEDITNSFENMHLADVDFIVQGKQFSSNKAFLSSRSKVFKNMFDSKVGDSETNVIIIDDIGHPVFQEMLSFLHTGIVNVDKYAPHLFCAAEKYKLEELKNMCEVSMIRNISVKTACDSLVFADRHNAVLLKTTAMKFITS